MALAKKKYKPRKPKGVVLDAKNIETAIVAVKKIKESLTPYTVTIKNGTEAYVGVGDTLVDAFQNVSFPSVFFPLKGSIKVEHNGKVEEKFLYPRQLKLFMRSKIKRTMWARLFSYAI